MKKLLFGVLCLLIVSNSAYADFRRGTGFNQGDLEMEDYPVVFAEKSADPSTPSTDEIKLYAKDNAGTTTLYTKDSSGAVGTLVLTTGNVATATALAANGADCSSGNAPLGVDASGAVESCFDVWTEAENTSAAYIANVSEDTSPTLGAALDAGGFDINNGGVIFLTEQADAEVDVAGKGQIWVNTATPNELWFTDDAGMDVQLGVSEFALDGTPDTDHTSNGPETNTFTAGATITAMDLVYMGGSSKWLLTDADADTTATGMLAISLESKTDTQAMNVALSGSFVRDDTFNWTPGAILYVDTVTPGAITATAPSGTADIVRVVGYAVTADVIWFEPSTSWVEIA